jgi:GT2 family glycosyltransferase
VAGKSVGSLTLVRGLIQRITSRNQSRGKGWLKSGADGLHFRIDTPARRKWTTRKTRLQVTGWIVDPRSGVVPNVRIRKGALIYRPTRTTRLDVRQCFPGISPQCGFDQTIDLRLGFQRIIIEIEVAKDQWRVIRDFVLFRLPSELLGTTQLSYQQWAKLEESLDRQERSQIAAHIDVMSVRPCFSVIIDGGTVGNVAATIRSIRNQYYPHWNLHIVAPLGDTSPRQKAAIARNVGALIPAISGDFVLFIRSGDRLAPRALYEFASALNADPLLDMIYADEDEIRRNGTRIRPFFKPDWSPDYLETFNYIGYPACFRTSLAKNCNWEGHYYDFVLRLTECTRRISHLRNVLCHRSIESQTTGTVAAQLDIDALEGRLNRTNRLGIVTPGKDGRGYFDITSRTTEEILVSIVIPTAGEIVSVGDRRIDLIVNCITHIADRSTYKNVEIIIVDNGDLAAERMKTLQDLQGKFITYNSPTVNISRKLNLGVSIARGKMLLLLNDDTQIIAPDWIERMLDHFEKPHVGVVGAKLLYADGTIQHAGVVHAQGYPVHVRQRYPRDDVGYFFSTSGVRNYAAVTGACMMTPTDLYRSIGGYSEEFAIAFNDIDYCQKVRSCGRHVVFAPRAELFHFEAQSRVIWWGGDENLLYQARWPHEVASDPHYNDRCLSVAPPSFEPCINRRWF